MLFVHIVVLVCKNRLVNVAQHVFNVEFVHCMATSVIEPIWVDVSGFACYKEFILSILSSILLRRAMLSTLRTLTIGVEGLETIRIQGVTGRKI